MAAEFGFHEGVDVAVHDVLDAGGFVTGAVVFDHLVGLEDVASYLATPSDVVFAAVGFVDFGAAFVLLDLVEFGFQHADGFGPVFGLGAFDLTGDDDAGGEVGDADGGFDFVDVLSAFAAGAVGVDFEIVIADFDFDVFLSVGCDVDGGEGGVALFGGVEGGDADEAMDAAFGLEEAVGVFAHDFEGSGADADFVALHVVDDLDFAAVAFGPALVHAEEHVGPVAGFGAAGTGVDGEVGVAAVERAGEEEVEFVFGDGVLDVVVFLGDFLEGGGDAFFFGHFDEDLEVFGAGVEGGQGFDAAFDAVDLVDDFAGVVLAIPEAGGGDAFFEFFELSGLGRDVKDTSGVRSSGL